MARLGRGKEERGSKYEEHAAVAWEVHVEESSGRSGSYDTDGMLCDDQEAGEDSGLGGFDFQEESAWTNHLVAVKLGESEETSATTVHEVEGSTAVKTSLDLSRCRPAISS